MSGPAIRSVPPSRSLAGSAPRPLPSGGPSPWAGALLVTSTDTAVNTSEFLDRDQRAALMLLDEQQPGVPR